MAERPRGIGRGLGAIISGSDRTPEGVLQQIPTTKIFANPKQPRRHFDQQKLTELAGSLSEHGLLQPVIVRPATDGNFELIAGERRWRAAQLAKLDRIPALIRSEDDGGSLQLALIENMARQDLNPIEEARACEILVQELGMTREQVGRRVGRSRVAISNLLRILELPDGVLALVEQGDLTEGHARALLILDDHTQRGRLADAAVAEQWSVRRLEQEARRLSGSELEPKRLQHSPAKERVDAEELAAITSTSERLTQLLKRDCNVRKQGDGYRVELEFSDFDLLAEWIKNIES